MMCENNVIELKRFRPETRWEEELRREARERREKNMLRSERLLNAVETVVTCAIGVGFTVCIALFLTML